MRTVKSSAILLVGTLVALSAMTMSAAQAAPAPGLHEVSDAQSSDFPTPDELKDRGVMAPLVNALSKATGDEGGTVATIDGEPNGFASFVVDNESHHIDLYWVGAVPESIQKLIAEHPEVDVTLHPAQYSLVKMLEARDALIEGYSRLDGDHGDLVTVGPDSEGRGLKLRVNATADTVNRDAVARTVEQLTDVNVASILIDEKQSVTLFSGGRQNDASPHYGGAFIRITNSNGTGGAWCSSGASVEGIATGNKYMTTAIHCMEDDPDEEIDSEGWVYNGAGALIGSWRWTSSQLQKDRHAILIKLKTGSTNSGRSYWGANDSTTSLPVVGTTTSPLGDSVCALGANTGAHCGGIVTDKNFALSHGGVWIIGMVEATRSSGLMAGTGDSGGPVAIVESNGDRSLAGFILGAPSASPSTCGTSALLSGSACSKVLWYTGGMTGYLDSLGVELR